MKHLFLLISILLQNASFAQNQEKHSKNRLMIKFKSNVGGEYRMFNSAKKLNDQELDDLNKKNKVQSIILSGNKKKKHIK